MANSSLSRDLQKIERSNLSWKQQKYNNSCAWDCLCILFSAWGVETDTYHLVGSSPIPYLIRTLEDGNFLQAGMLVQSEEVINAVTGLFGFSFRNHRFTSCDEFFSFAGSCLSGGNPFMTSIPGHFVPLWDSSIRIQPSSKRHALVIGSFSNSCYCGFDPDGGLDRGKVYDYREVKDKVSFRVEESELRTMLESDAGHQPIIGCLQPANTTESSDVCSELIAESLPSIDIFCDRASQFDYSDPQALTVITDIIKPIALDLRIAVEILDKNNHRNSELARLLGELESNTLTARRTLSNGRVIAPDIQARLKLQIRETGHLLRGHCESAAIYKWNGNR